jgi:hypothetical protein
MEHHDRMNEGSLNRRLEEIGWALFLIMVGVLWLLPDDRVPPGMWLIGAGLIMLAVNAARYLKSVATSAFTVVLGLLAIAAGAVNFYGGNFPIFPVLLIVLGGSIILRPFTRRQS